MVSSQAPSGITTVLSDLISKNSIAKHTRPFSKPLFSLYKISVEPMFFSTSMWVQGVSGAGW